MKKLLLLIIVSLSGVAGASVWERLTVDGPGNWNDPANWDGGVPIVSTVYTVLGQEASDLAEAQVTDTQTFGKKLSVGGTEELSTGAAGAVLRIRDGGSLLSGNSATRSYIGYSADAKMIIDEGGTFTHSHRLVLGFLGGVTGIVDVYGTLNMLDNNTYLGGYEEFVDGIGKLNVRGDGVANLRSLADDRLFTYNDESFVDLSSNGKIVIAGDGVVDEVDTVNARIVAGDIVGYGIVGNVEAVYDEFTDTTTITAIDDPLDREPAYGEHVDTGDVVLSWVNLGTPDVWVDVWYGVNPQDGNDIDLAKVVDAGLNTTTKTVPAPDDARQYVWRVDTYFGNPATTDPNEGLPMAFIAFDDIPATVVIDTPPTATWKNEPIQLNITVTDDGDSTVEFLWESDDPNAIFVVPGTLTEDNTLEEPEVVCNYASGPFNVTVTVSDGNTLGIVDSARVELDCRENQCSASRLGVGLDPAGDINNDCSIDLTDIVMLGAKWTEGYAAEVPYETPQ